MHTEALTLLESGDLDKSAKLSKHAYQSEREARIHSMVSLARWWEGVPLVPEELDGDPWVLNVENGTIDLRTGELREHRQSDRITKLAPVKFDPDAKAPRFYSLRRAIMGGNLDPVRFIQRALC